MVQDIATLIEVYRLFPHDPNHTQLRRIAQEKLGLVVDFLPVGESAGTEAFLFPGGPGPL